MYENVWYVVVAVKDVAQAKKDYEEKLGLKASGEPEDSPQLGIRRVIIPFGDTVQFIELVEPLGEHSAIRPTLERRGEGIHTVTLAVDDVRAAAEDLRRRGTRIVETGAQVFIHPSETHGVLWQLRKRE